MQRPLVIICALFGYLLLTLPCRAQGIQSPGGPGSSGQLSDSLAGFGKYQNYVYGVVKKISHNEIVLDKTMYGDGQVFKLEHKTKFIHNGKASSLAELKVGEMVWVDAKIKKRGEDKIARKVLSGMPPSRTLR